MPPARHPPPPLRSGCTSSSMRQAGMESPALPADIPLCRDRGSAGRARNVEACPTAQAVETRGDGRPCFVTLPWAPLAVRRATARLVSQGVTQARTGLLF